MRLATVALLCASVGIAAWAADAPKPAAPFQMTQLRGPNITFAQYRGKVLAVTFILTTCPHCQDLTNVLSAIAREYAPLGVQFLECAFNDDARATMGEFLDRFHPPFPVGWTNQAAVRAY